MMNPAPDSPRAISPLVHSSSFPELPAILGPCSSSTHEKNMTPRRMPESRVTRFTSVLSAAARKANPTP